MSRQKILKKLKEKNPKIKKSHLETILDSFFKNIENSLIDQNSVEIRSFGSFFVKQINEKKQARNPKTGEKVSVPKKRTIKWKMSKDLFKKLNNEKE